MPDTQSTASSLAELHVEADLLGRLAQGPLARGLTGVGLDGAAGQRPPVAVVRLDEQHTPLGVAEERGGAAQDTGETRDVRGELGGGSHGEA